MNGKYLFWLQMAYYYSRNRKWTKKKGYHQNNLKTFFLYFQYFHNGADTLSDKFTLVARTSTKTSVPATVNIQIIPVNDEVPRIVNNTGVEVWAGSSAIITTNDLSKLYEIILSYFQWDYYKAQKVGMTATSYFIGNIVVVCSRWF